MNLLEGIVGDEALVVVNKDCIVSYDPNRAFHIHLCEAFDGTVSPLVNVRIL
jgi:hypothetical protein